MVLVWYFISIKVDEINLLITNIVYIVIYSPLIECFVCMVSHSQQHIFLPAVEGTVPCYKSQCLL